MALPYLTGIHFRKHHVFNKGRSPFNCWLYDFPSFLLESTPMYLFIAKYLFTGSFKNRSIDIQKRKKIYI